MREGGRREEGLDNDRWGRSERLKGYAGSGLLQYLEGVYRYILSIPKSEERKKKERKERAQTQP